MSKIDGIGREVQQLKAQMTVQKGEQNILSQQGKVGFVDCFRNLTNPAQDSNRRLLELGEQLSELSEMVCGHAEDS